MIIIVSGISIVKNNIAVNSLLKGNLNLAKPYAATAQETISKTALTISYFSDEMSPSL